MSTKTTFKRIALVAVASLGLGVLASAPSNAAPTFAYGVIADSTAGQAIIGGQATVVVTLDTNTITMLSVTGVGSVVGTTQDSTTVTGTVTTGSWTDSSTTAGTVKGTQTITITSAVAGTTTVSATPLSATGVPGTAVTKTIKWVAATSTGSYDHAHAYISGANVAYRSGAADSTTAQLTFASTLAATPVATIAVTQFNAADTTTATTLSATGTKAIVATITGAGAVGSTQNGSDAGASVTIAAGSSGATAEDYLYVYPDGRNGTATIAVTVNGVAVATKTVNFFGTVKSYAADADLPLSKNQIGVGTLSGADAESATVSIKGKDALGTIMASGTIYATSDTSTIATVTVVGSDLFIYGVAVGKTNINVCNTASCTSATIKYSFPIEVTKKTAKTVTWAFDKASYTPGEKMTLTVTATDSNGRPVADGSRALLAAAMTANISPNGTLPAASAALVDGKATYTLYAPIGAGKLTLSSTEGAAVDQYIAGVAAAALKNTTYTAAAVTVSAEIVNASADAASAAAEAAEAAANDATDAAITAGEAAEAASALAQEAVDAVAELSASVTKLISALKAQITTLTNLVIKIQKKVKA
jgi:hypothetical protein